MKNILSCIALSLILFSCQSGIEGNGNVKKETREAAPFDRIDVDGAFDIFIRSGNYSAVTINADENLLEHIESYVKNGVLHVSSEKRFSHFEKLELYLTMNEFNGADLSGACEIETRGMMKGGDVELDFSGAVEGNLEIKCDEIDVDMSGACELHLKGYADEAKYEISGAGEIDAENFKTTNCKIDISGAGEARVYVTDKLDIDVSGASEVRYKGNPGEVNQHVSGAATIKPL